LAVSWNVNPVSNKSTQGLRVCASKEELEMEPFNGAPASKVKLSGGSVVAGDVLVAGVISDGKASFQTSVAIIRRGTSELVFPFALSSSFPMTFTDSSSVGFMLNSSLTYFGAIASNALQSFPLFLEVLAGKADISSLVTSAVYLNAVPSASGSAINLLSSEGLISQPTFSTNVSSLSIITIFLPTQIPRVDQVQPTIGRISGNNQLTISGTGFLNSSDLSCAFQAISKNNISVTYTPGVFFSAHSVLCSSPKSPSNATDKVAIFVRNSATLASLERSAFLFF
jgi:hypothetical protein